MYSKVELQSFKDCYSRSTKKELLKYLKDYLIFKRCFQSHLFFYLEKEDNNKIKFCIDNLIECEVIIDLINYYLNMYDFDLKNEDGSLNENGVLTEKVRKLVKNKDVIGSVSLYNGLIDNCKYIICCNRGYADFLEHCEKSSFPARSIKQCAELFDCAYYKI